MNYIPRVQYKIIVEQCGCYQRNSTNGDGLNISVKECIAQEDTQPNTYFPTEEERTLHCTALTMLGQLDEEQQEAASEQPQTKADHGRDV